MVIATLEFTKARVDSPRTDARLLLRAAAGLTAEHILGHPGAPLEAAARDRLWGFIRRRIAREPVSRILGRREFWGLEFALTPDTLDPRPDSETVVEAALAAVVDRDAALAVLDLGTGSGCLLLALLSELPRAAGVGVDSSAGACKAAGENAAALGLAARAKFVCGDWGLDLCGRFNLIVINPPYIPDEDIDGLEPEVARYDPRRALAGGADGLDCYRALIPGLGRLMTPEAFAVLEIGADQAEVVTELLAGAGLEDADVVRDLAGRERAIVVRRARK